MDMRRHDTFGANILARASSVLAVLALDAIFASQRLTIMSRGTNSFRLELPLDPPPCSSRKSVLQSLAEFKTTERPRVHTR